MFFSAKAKGFVIDHGESAVFLARNSVIDSVLTIEAMQELPAGDSAGITEGVKAMMGKSASGYAHAVCGICPPKRLIRRHALDAKRLKEPAYLNEIYTQTFRIEPEKYTIKTLTPNDGLEADLSKPLKEVLFCGMQSDDIVAAQDKLLGMGLYPECLELTTVATLGALVNYLSFKQSKVPVLLLEIGEQNTQSFILNADGVEITRPIPSGLSEMIPVVQKELGLKDDESARKLFYSNTFDFTGMGGQLIKRLLKELQSSIGFYEVQTGQSIAHVLCTQLPPNMGWLANTVAGALGVTTLKMDLLPWLGSLNIKLADGAQPAQFDERWLGLCALMASYSHAVAPAVAVKKE